MSAPPFARDLASVFEDKDITILAFYHGPLECPEGRARTMTDRERKMVADALQFYAYRYEAGINATDPPEDSR